MSGIVGIVNFDDSSVDHNLLKQMTQFLAYRGPDAQETWIDGGIGFGHTMLRTTFEAQHEKQPLTLDGRTWLTADARIDGRAELISKLETKLERHVRQEFGLKVPNDAELILLSYKAWGEHCIKHLIGDFAFAIWDSSKKRLFCARDHLGVRQFYYCLLERSLIFSNTLRCILMHPRVSSRLFDQAVADFLLFGFKQDETATTFADIRNLPRAHVLTFSGDGFHLRRYWTPEVRSIVYRRQDEYLESFRNLLVTAVSDRLRTTRAGVSMSGGMDSSAVAAIATQEGRNALDLRAYCIVYDSVFADQERQYASQVAHALNIPLEFLEGHAINANGDHGTTNTQAPEPEFVQPFLAVLEELLRRISSHGRVALTGWDGDTLMSESPKYGLAALKSLGPLRLIRDMCRYLNHQRRLPPIGFRTYLKRLGGKYPPRIPFPIWINEDFAKSLNLRERWMEANYLQSRHCLRPRAFGILSSAEWASFFGRYDANVTLLPLEVRHPLIDIRVVEYLLGIPVIPWLLDKEIERRAMSGLLPESVCQRPKSPLADDPALHLNHSSKFLQIDEFRASPAVLPYINREAVPRISGEMDSTQLWMNVRAFTLNHWLLHSQPLNLA